MKKYYVYELYDELGSLWWVGMTLNPKQRLRQHTCINGKFYGWDMEMEIVKEFTDKKEAEAFEGQRKQYWGMEWTEQTRYGKGGKISGKTNGKIQGKKNVESGHMDKIRKKAYEVCSTPVIAYNKKTGEFVGEYKSQHEAARTLNIKSVGNICEILNNKRKSAGGYTFRYK